MSPLHVLEGEVESTRPWESAAGADARGNGQVGAADHGKGLTLGRGSINPESGDKNGQRVQRNGNETDCQTVL